MSEETISVSEVRATDLDIAPTSDSTSEDVMPNTELMALGDDLLASSQKSTDEDNVLENLSGPQQEVLLEEPALAENSAPTDDSVTATQAIEETFGLVPTESELSENAAEDAYVDNISNEYSQVQSTIEDSQVVDCIENEPQTTDDQSEEQIQDSIIENATEPEEFIINTPTESDNTIAIKEVEATSTVEQTFDDDQEMSSQEEEENIVALDTSIDLHEPATSIEVDASNNQTSDSQEKAEIEVEDSEANIETDEIQQAIEENGEGAEVGEGQDSDQGDADFENDPTNDEGKENEFKVQPKTPEAWTDNKESEDDEDQGEEDTDAATIQTQPTWAEGLTQDDIEQIHKLGALTRPELITEVKKLYDQAYKLGVKEAKEMTKAKYLNIFSSHLTKKK